jgi:hypothetical protein
LNKYAQVQWALSLPTFGKGHQHTQFLKRTVRMRKARRKPIIRRRRPRLIWMEVRRLAEAESE